MQGKYIPGVSRGRHPQRMHVNFHKGLILGCKPQTHLTRCVSWTHLVVLKTSKGLTRGKSTGSPWINLFLPRTPEVDGMCSRPRPFKSILPERDCLGTLILRGLCSYAWGL